MHRIGVDFSEMKFDFHFKNDYLFPGMICSKVCFLLALLLVASLLRYVKYFYLGSNDGSLEKIFCLHGKLVTSV